MTRRRVVPAFQPLVDLQSDQVVGYEALARGPQGPLETPDRLFEVAREVGRVVDVDWLCRDVALDEARRAGVRLPLALFINAEPETLDAVPLERWRQMRDVRCYAEVTERALLADPAGLLRAIDRVRSQDWGVALDDIGQDPASLAFMPMLQPDVLKLDRSLLAGPPDAQGSRVLHAVLTQAQESGAAVVAEGLETEEQRDRALAHGIGLGQGWLLGRPGPLPARLDYPATQVPLLDRLVDRAVTPAPFGVVTSKVRPSRVPAARVAELVEQLVVEARRLEPSPVLLVGTPSSTPAGVPQPGSDLHGLDHLPLVAVLRGADQGEAARQGRRSVVGEVRSTVLRAGDPARADWSVVVITPYWAGAVVARPADTSSPPVERWTVALTFDRGLCIQAANSLLVRLAAQRSAPSRGTDDG